MSRAGYSEDGSNWDIIRWRGQVASSIRGKRGQSFLRELVEALEAMPEKRLIKDELRKDGEVCALGALGVKRGMSLELLDPHFYEEVAEAFGIASPLAQEVVWENDDVCHGKTPEQRWAWMHAWAKSLLKPEAP